MKKLFFYLRRKLLSDLTVQLASLEEKISNTYTGRESQLILKNQYKNLSEENITKYSFGEVGFRRYSQNTKMEFCYLFFL